MWAASGVMLSGVLTGSLTGMILENALGCLYDSAY